MSNVVKGGIVEVKVIDIRTLAQLVNYVAFDLTPAGATFPVSSTTCAW
jgi:hypothetical protein